MRQAIPIEPGDLVRRILKNVPDEMLTRKQWTLWKVGDGRKIPLSCNGNYASCTDPATWSNFATASKVFLRHSDICRGFNIATGDGLAGLDLDEVVAPDGTISETMRLFIDHLGSYTELSPSGTGLHSFFLYEQPHENRKSGNIEMYFDRHFLSITGNIFQERDRLAFADVGAERILTALRPRRPLLPRIPLREIPLSDSELLEKMFNSKSGSRIRNLWDGESPHKSPSESDMALMGHLAYWCGGDTGRMISLFLTSGRAERVKAQRKDYLQRMAAKVAKNL